MTDTLREVCVAFAGDIIIRCQGHISIPEDSAKIKWIADRLEAFAKRQRAAEVREAGKHIVENEDDFTGFAGGPIPSVEFDAEQFAQWCEARAKEWET